MYINKVMFKARRYSSGEYKFIKSDLDKYIIDNKVEILYVGEYTLFELLLILNYYLKKDVKVDLILGYLPYQRMDHKDRYELDTVNYVANIFNSLNLNSITICEPHCEVSCFSNVKKFSYVRNIKKEVFKEIGFDDKVDVIVLPDKGGVKRYGDISNNIVYFDKVRDSGSGLIVKHKIVGNIDVNSKIVIVDDIISTGDTVVNIIEELTRLGVKNIYILSGHIENNKYNKRILSFSNVIRVYSTNSLKKKSNNKKLKLYSVKGLIYS